MPLVFETATAGLVNMMLALAVSISLLAAFHMLESPRRRWVYAVICGVGLSMGLMTKGPLVLMFFVPTMLLYAGFQRGGRLADDWRWSLPYMALMALLVWLSLFVAVRAGPAGAALYVLPVGMLLYFGLRGRSRASWDKRWLIVIAVTLLLSAPWPILAARRLGFEPLWRTLVQQAWQSRSSAVGASNRGPIWYYLLALPAAALPYSLLAPLPGTELARRTEARRLHLDLPFPRLIPEPGDAADRALVEGHPALFAAFRSMPTPDWEAKRRFVTRYWAIGSAPRSAPPATPRPRTS